MTPNLQDKITSIPVSGFVCHSTCQQDTEVGIQLNTVASPKGEDIIEKDFRILARLQFGSFGEVELACHLPTHTQVAVKILKKANNHLDDITSEGKIHQSLEHRNIVQLFHVIDTPTVTYMVMEFVEGRDLQMFLSERDYLKEEEAKPIFQQAVSGLHFLHQRHIAHCDIKLENILMDRAGKVKLCDFGMATQLSEGQMLTKIRGTLHYMAPEMLARKPYDGLAVDMWSLGVVLYVLVTGEFPYESTTIDGMHKIISSTDYPIPYNLSRACQILISQLLTVCTQKRMTTCQLLKESWLGNMKEHAGPTTQNIIPRVVESMCNIGYTCDEILSALTHRQPNNKVMTTFKILKHKLISEDSPQEREKPWSNISSAGSLRSLHPMKRRASEPAFPAIRESVKRRRV